MIAYLWPVEAGFGSNKKPTTDVPDVTTTKNAVLRGL
jgi:hypothetical protein